MPRWFAPRSLGGMNRQFPTNPSFEPTGSRGGVAAHPRCPPELITSPHAGELPGDGETRFGPAGAAIGRLVYADPARYANLPPQGWTIDSIGCELHQAVVCQTLWGTLAADFGRSGLWPVIGVQTDRLARSWERYRKPETGYRERGTTLRSLFGLDQCEPWMESDVHYCFGCGVVVDRSGELSVPGRGRDASLLDEITIQDVPQGSITLVPVDRPADAVAVLGWTGSAAAGWFGADVACVLRSWEERFGAYVLSAERSSLTLVVTRPPRTADEARLVAREHLHFGRTNYGYHGISSYVSRLIHGTTWSFWWDSE